MDVRFRLFLFSLQALVRKLGNKSICGSFEDFDASFLKWLHFTATLHNVSSEWFYLEILGGGREIGCTCPPTSYKDTLTLYSLEVVVSFLEYVIILPTAQAFVL